MAERTQEQKERIRRRNFVRRIVDRVPLFVMEEIRQRYPDYDDYMLRDDLKTRRKKAIKPKKTKMADDFRSRQLDKYLELLKQTDPDAPEYNNICIKMALLNDAHNQRKRIEIMVKKEGEGRIHYFMWQTSERSIKEFIILANQKTSTWDDLKKKQDDIINTTLGRNPK